MTTVLTPHMRDLTWRRIAVDAANIVERQKMLADHPLDAPSLDDARLQALTKEGFSTKEAAAILSCSVQHLDTLPAWIVTLRKIVDQAGRQRHTYVGLLQSAPFTDQDPLPFQHLLPPMLHTARTYLCDDILQETILPQLERQLAQHLSNTMAPTLCRQLAERRGPGHNFLLNIIGPEQGSGNAYLYQALVDDLYADGFLSFFQQYPALARVIVDQIIDWCANTQAFITRLRRDLPTLRRSHHLDGPLNTLELDCSDPHDHGRTVSILHFSQGKIVYKPRDLSLEQTFATLLHKLPQDLVAPTLTLCEDEQGAYGWSSFVAQRSCENTAQIAAFYKRSGMFLALMYLLDASDCHDENIIADRDQPVWIDLETLLHQNLAADKGRSVWRTVIRTGMLPAWRNRGDGGLEDISALGFTDTQRERSVLVWLSVNCDDMRPHWVGKTQQTPTNLPTLDGVRQPPAAYLNDILDGFETMIRQWRDPGTQKNLEDFAGKPSRFLLRPTADYTAILRQSLEPEFMTDGVSRDLVCPPNPHVESKHLLVAEREALRRLDIPRFSTMTDQCALQGVDVSPFSQSAFDRVTQNLTELDEADLKFQTSLIRETFQARFLIEEPDGASSRPDLQKMTHHIAQQLKQRIIYTEHQAPNWIGMHFFEHSCHYQLLPLNDNLYDGRGGPLLFLAAYARLHNDAESEAIAINLGDAMALALDGSSLIDKVRAQGCGAYFGPISTILSLLQAHQWLERPLWIETSTKALTLLTKEVAASQKSLDLTHGYAGAVITLLEGMRLTNHAPLLKHASDIGRSLVNQAIPQGIGVAWPTYGDHCLTGFAHGAAGITYALLELFDMTQDTIFADTAMKALAFLEQNYDQKTQTWPEFPGSGTFRHSWCHGTPGLLMCLLSAKKYTNYKFELQNLEMLAESLKTHAPTGVDHLCCGTFGNISALRVIGDTLGRNTYIEDAKNWATENLATPPILFPNLTGSVFNPSALQGLSGIGFELLRLLHPTKQGPEILKP